ncbi:DUF4232 domain-containing protein [Kitasatospora sp. NPDC056783]|uniref:DUF4232 domain-containing protein n=1 Tax=Kitasatospora sp. NPDC056783 TaxID=3345943 RepID=UPI003699B6A9
MRQNPSPRGLLTGRRRAAAAATAAALLLTGCASAATTASGRSPDASGTPGSCGTPPPTVPGAPQPAGLAQGGARITSIGPLCAEYEMTNPNGEPYDVTVVFGVPAMVGGGLENQSRSVIALAPGATERGRLVYPGATVRSGTRPQPRIVTARSVPTAEAPDTGGPCPSSGLRLYADEGSAAMGLRAVGVHLRNCGTATVTLEGYPQVQPLDAGHKPLDGVRVLRGGAEIASGTGADDPPRKIALGPGEGARSVLVWRNTTEAGTPRNAPYVRVRATPDAAPVMVTPELDLGTTGRLGAGAWVREETNDTASARPAP